MKNANCLSSMYILLLLVEIGVSEVTIQGSRSFGSSDWVTDNGSPLPYLPSTQLFAREPSATVLTFTVMGEFWATFTDTPYIPAFACEIEN